MKSPTETTALILKELQIPPHRIGYNHLCVAIPAFARDRNQAMAKELYVTVAVAISCDWRAVERAIRYAIAYAWKRRDPEVWAQYFPFCKRPPSNKHFIATIAERIK
ncbi:MAG: hypothetical protein E7461_08010 [Ruminococcaceae bacterium]|nr:hypothetical protein [Oscillospiraceae bacterium]